MNNGDQQRSTWEAGLASVELTLWLPLVAIILGGILWMANVWHIRISATVIANDCAQAAAQNRLPDWRTHQGSAAFDSTLGGYGASGFQREGPNRFTLGANATTLSYVRCDAVVPDPDEGTGSFSGQIYFVNPSFTRSMGWAIQGYRSCYHPGLPGIDMHDDRHFNNGGSEAITSEFCGE